MDKHIRLWIDCNNLKPILKDDETDMHDAARRLQKKYAKQIAKAVGEVIKCEGWENETLDITVSFHATDDKSTMMNKMPIPMPEGISDPSELDPDENYITVCAFCESPVILMACETLNSKQRHHPVNLTPMGFVSQIDSRLHGGYQSHVHTCTAITQWEMKEGDTP